MKKLLTDKSSKKTKIAIAAISVGVLALALFVSTGFYAGMTNTINTLMNTVKSGLESIYGGMLGIVTVLAVVICGYCFLVKMFSKNPRSIDEASQWIKRVAIAWICFMLLSVFVKVGLDLVTSSSANTAQPWT